MKKITIIILIVVLLFTFSLNVKAVTITTDNTKQGTTDTGSYLVTNTGTITINNIENDTFKGYKILDFYYNSTSNNITHEFTSDFKAFLASTTEYKDLTVDQYKNLTSGDTTNYSTQTDSTLDKLVSKYATYIASNNVAGENLTTTPPPDAMTRGYATGEFNVGSYLVLPVNSSKVYAVMVGNIDLEYENSTWSVVNATINAKVSSTSITKNIVSGATLNNNKYYINPTNAVTNSLTVTIPEYPTNAVNHQLAVKFDEDIGARFTSISINDGSDSWNIGSENLEYMYDTTLTNNNNNKVGYIIVIPSVDYLGGSGTNKPSVTIIFNTDYINSDSITIEYSTDITLNEDNIGSNGFTSTYGMRTNPYESETYDDGWYKNFEVTDTETFKLYSYGIKITTKDGSNNSLTGASYKLYSDASLNTEVGSFTTDDSVSTIIGLAPGTYYAKQTSSPNGASINNETFTVDIPESQQGYVELTVTNNSTSTLPVTGGAGTAMFLILGLFVIGGAIVYYKYSNALKKNAEV